MKSLLLTSFSLFLLGCPTPPNPTSQGNNQPAGQNQQNKNPNDQGSQGAQNNPGDQAKGPQGPKNPEGPGGPGGNLQTPTQNTLLPPENQEELADGAIVGLFNETGGTEPPPRYSQEAIKEKEHITISGSITCDGDDCEKPMIMRVTPFTAPDMEDGKPKPAGEGAPEPKDDPKDDLPETEELIAEIQAGVITSASITSTGEFNLVTLKSDSPIVLELIIDSNSDGSPSPGEKFVIFEGGGGIVPNQDRKDISFKFSSDAVKAPLGGTRPPDQDQQ